MPKLRFLLDADMPRSSAEVMRSIGLEVADVRDIGMRGAKDKEIIEYALKNSRIIVTKDTDFGEVLRYPKHPGAIIFRLLYANLMYILTLLSQSLTPQPLSHTRRRGVAAWGCRERRRFIIFIIYFYALRPGMKESATDTVSCSFMNHSS